MKSELVKYAGVLLAVFLLNGCGSLQKKQNIVIETVQSGSETIVLMAYPDKDYRLFVVDKSGNAILEAHRIGESSQHKSK